MNRYRHALALFTAFVMLALTPLALEAWRAEHPSKALHALHANAAQRSTSTSATAAHLTHGARSIASPHG